jgi:hypothetical protein
MAGLLAWASLIAFPSRLMRDSGEVFNKANGNRKLEMRALIHH